MYGYMFMYRQQVSNVRLYHAVNLVRKYSLDSKLEHLQCEEATDSITNQD